MSFKFLGKSKKDMKPSDPPPPYSESKNPDVNTSTSMNPPPGYPGQPCKLPENSVQQPIYPGQQIERPIVACFEAGARFKPNQPIIIPPPPPGAPVLPAQAAAYNGQPVVAVQKKSDFWMGGSSSGAVLY